MKDELRRPMTLLVKAAIPKNCKEETSKPFSNQKEIRRSLLVDKLVDELAKGKAMEKIKRTTKKEANHG